MLDSVFSKSFCIIGFIVEPDDHGDSKFLEDRNIIFGRKEFILGKKNEYPIFVNGFIIGRAKSNEFIWDDPVQVPIFYSFEVLIFVEVKRLKVKPT